MPITKRCLGISEFLRLPAVSDFGDYRAGAFLSLTIRVVTAGGGGIARTHAMILNFIQSHNSK